MGDSADLEEEEVGPGAEIGGIGARTHFTH